MRLTSAMSLALLVTLGATTTVVRANEGAGQQKTPEQVATYKAQSVMSEELRQAKKACSSKSISQAEMIRCVEEKMGQPLPGGSYQRPTPTTVQPSVQPSLTPTIQPTLTPTASPSADPTPTINLTNEEDELVSAIQEAENTTTIVRLIRDYIARLLSALGQ